MAVPDREKIRRLQINPPVFLTAAILTLALVIFAILAPGFAERLFADTQAWVADALGWFYMLAVGIFTVFVIALAISRFGVIKLGPDDSRPDYSYASWFAMLFSAGMGIGLLFFGVAEPVLHYVDPPLGEGRTVAAAREAMSQSFFHWGLHAWAIYIVIGLALAYFSFRHNLPLTMRSALYPLLGERIRGRWGDAVDIFAVLGTLFGVATSLGLGVMQVNAGLDHLFGTGVGLPIQLGLIAGITALATISVVSGLDGGVKRLSELNLFLALILLLFVLFTGPTAFLLKAYGQNVATYLSSVVAKTLSLYAYEPSAKASEWISDWTLFYWGWWISWSPFVGMFIARVSRGRSIREFVLGVLFVPAGFTFLWLTVFGGTALNLDLTGSSSAVVDVVQVNIPLALFTLLEQLPLGAITSFIAVVLVITFFVTSSDSGSLVIDMITSGGSDNPPVWQRVFWAVGEGAVAAVLLLVGGLAALQAAAITTALPLAFIMLVVCYGIWRGLSRETGTVSPPRAAQTAPVLGALFDWRHRLDHILRRYSYEEARAFLTETAEPALREVAMETQKRGFDTDIDSENDAVTLTVHCAGGPDFRYGIALQGFRSPRFAFPEIPRKGEEKEYFRAQVILQTTSTERDLMGFPQSEVIADILIEFQEHLRILNIGRDNRLFGRGSPPERT